MATLYKDVPESFRTDFDFTDESIVESVHERLAAIQQSTGVAYSPHGGGHWMVTGYDDVAEVSRNDRVFSAVDTALGRRMIPVHYDPPEHTAYRQLLNPMFSPGRMRILAEDIRTTSKELLDRFAAEGSCDFVASFSHPLPTRTFLALMGWPSADEPMLSAWSEALILGKEGASLEENAAYRASVDAEVGRYFEAMVEERRQRPELKDVTASLLQSRYANQRSLTDEELITILSELMVAGLHTVRGVLSYGLIYLCGRPEIRDALVADPSFIPNAVEEFLRLGVGTAPAREVIQPVTLRGAEMQPGDRVMMMLSAANRDPAVFEEPNELLLRRKHNRHLTFAVGRHRCLGSNLARLELTIALEEILSRIPDFHLDPQRPPRFHHSQIRGVRELYLVFM